jgi:tetratricopeptide (TPR) repeat protein
VPKARDYAAKALELNDSLPEAHASLGIVKLIFEWDWMGAEKELKHNLPLSPQSLDAFSCAAHYADPVGHNSEAIAEIKRALELDNLSLVSNLELGCASYYGKQYDQALTQFHKTLSLDPNSALAYYGLGRAYSGKKMYQNAISELTRGAMVTHRWPPVLSELGFAYAQAGNTREAQRVIQELKDQSRDRYIDPPFIAAIYLGLDDEKQSLDWLDKAYDERSMYMAWLKVEPKWDPLHHDPRFSDLLQRVGFSPF